MANYWQKLKDPRWQKRRLEILSAAEFACEACGDGSATLHVHHLKYDKGKDPWDYGNEWLVCFCESCHEEWHEAKEMLIQALAGLDSTAIRKVAGYAFGLSGTQFEMFRKGIQRMNDASDNDVADGIYDAVRKWLPRDEGAPDAYEYHIPSLFSEGGAIERDRLWSAYADTLGRKREQ